MFECYIIGYPLNKPRSVKIWKNYFKLKNINSSMSSLEVKKNKLKQFFNGISNNKNFLASAVTSPLKIISYKYIIPGDIITKRAGSINLIIKKKNLFYGYNTDIISLIKIIKKYKKKKYSYYRFRWSWIAIIKSAFKNKKF